MPALHRFMPITLSNRAWSWLLNISCRASADFPGSSLRDVAGRHAQIRSFRGCVFMPDTLHSKRRTSVLVIVLVSYLMIVLDISRE